MAIFSSIFRKRPFFTKEEEERIVAAIRECERKTSGEIRVFVESRCRFVDPLDRAMEVFFKLEMEHTESRNGVLIYIATKDRQMAVFGDEGIHHKVGKDFWDMELKKMIRDFYHADYVKGIIQVVRDVGDALQQHFPYLRDDRNELPDNIVFGR